MQADEAKRAEMRRAYETSSETVDAIAKRFGVTARTVLRRAKAGGWISRRGRDGKAAETVTETSNTTDSAAPSSDAADARLATEARQQSGDGCSSAPDEAVGIARPMAVREPDTREARVLRALRMIDLQFDQMEKWMSTKGPGTPQDQERQARAFSTVVGQIEVVTEMMPADGEGPEEVREPDDDKRRETERLRNEIAARLERLNQQWLAQAKSE